MIFRKILATAAAIGLLSLSLFAQDPSGGVKGTVVNRADKSPVAGATLKLRTGAAQLHEVTTDAEGRFQIDALADGMYDLVIEAPGFLPTTVNVTVNDGFVKNMFNVSLSPSVTAGEVDDSSFGEFDLDGTGYEDTPTILYDQNDVFNNIAGYNFSAVRFRARGYASESQDVYVAGVKMNDALTGYSPYSLWSGLNEVMRAKTAVIGSEISPYGIGGYNGLSNLYATPAQVRPGKRFSILTNSGSVISGSVEIIITPKTVTVKAENKSKTYGATDPELTYTAEGLMEGDRVSGTRTPRPRKSTT